MIESTLYSLGIGAYSSGVRLAALHNSKALKLVQGHKDAWLRLSEMIHDKPWIWIHAASLGEFEQGRPLIERLKTKFPGYNILLTFFSPSGYEIRKNYKGADLVCYLPFDSHSNARRFINIVQPKMVFFIKYEIWRNYLRELHKRGIPTYLVSAAFRPQQAFFKPYGALYRQWLKLFTRIFVQDDASRDLLCGIGIKDAVVAGDTRFDRVTDIMNECRQLPDIQRFVNSSKRKNKKILIVGSSWQPDEDAYIPWINSRKDVATIIAPHEFDDARIESLRNSINLNVILYSELTRNPELADSADVIIINCFGILSSLYRFADIAYVGGGFGVGIHNINEAAVYGIPVVFGPNYHRFIEAEELIQNQGAISCRSRTEVRETLDSLCDNDEDRERRGNTAGLYIQSRLGASDRIFSTLFPEEKPEEK